MTEKLDELLATRSTLAEALILAEDTPGAESEAQDLRGAIASIDAVMAPIREAEQRLGESRGKLLDAHEARKSAVINEKIANANAAFFDAQVNPADLSRAFNALFNNDGETK